MNHFCNSQPIAHTICDRSQAGNTKRQLFLFLPSSAALLHTVFAMFDTSGDGEISQEEFREALNKMGRRLTDDQLDALIRQIDVDHSGTISIKEFLTAVKMRLI